MKAGRELDRLIAEKVMGIKIKDPRQLLMPAPGYGPRVSLYSTEIEAAWEVVEALVKLRPKSDTERFSIIREDDAWVAGFEVFEVHEGWWFGKDSADAETVPLAICLAALEVIKS